MQAGCTAECPTDPGDPADLLAKEGMPLLYGSRITAAVAVAVAVAGSEHGSRAAPACKPETTALGAATQPTITNLWLFSGGAGTLCSIVVHEAEHYAPPC